MKVNPLNQIRKELVKLRNAQHKQSVAVQQKRTEALKAGKVLAVKL